MEIFKGSNNHSFHSPAIGTALDSHHEGQALVEVEEKKLLNVSDTPMSHSTNEPRAQNQNNDASSKKLVQKKRHK